MAGQRSPKPSMGVRLPLAPHAEILPPFREVKFLDCDAVEGVEGYSKNVNFFTFFETRAPKEIAVAHAPPEGWKAIG